MRPYLLDISRSLSRVGLGTPTGIDRVELAYIRHALQGDRPAYFLTRHARGFALIDRAGMAKLAPILRGEVPPAGRDITAIMSRRLNPMQGRAQSAARRFALANCRRAGLADMLVKHFAPGFAYLNVGHSNRNAEIWAAMRQGGAGISLAMVHDTIPLDWPQFSRAGLAARFADDLRATAQGADIILCNSADTLARTGAWLAKWNLAADLRLTPLGCDALAQPPDNLILTKPAEFVVLGTIEPRKNHALLFDVWSRMVNEPNAPHLHIIGRRGWENEAVFARLDHDQAMGTRIFEHSTLDDAALAQRLIRARALLFPSFAEGFGYPLIEALQLRIPVICSDLPAFRALAGSAATYLPPDDVAAWLDAIRNASHIPPDRPAKIDFPTWDSHFSFIDDFCA